MLQKVKNPKNEQFDVVILAPEPDALLSSSWSECDFSCGAGFLAELIKCRFLPIYLFLGITKGT